MAAAICSFCPVSMPARPLTSRPAALCSRPRTPMMTGVSRPIRVRVDPSPMPTNLPPPRSSKPRPPRRATMTEGRFRSAAWARPGEAAGDGSQYVGGLLRPRQLPAGRPPPGVAATPAKPLKIEGTAADTAVCAVVLSKPDAVASFPTISGVNKREMVDRMSMFMEESFFVARRLSSQATSDAHRQVGAAESPIKAQGGIGDLPELSCQKPRYGSRSAQSLRPLKQLTPIALRTSTDRRATTSRATGCSRRAGHVRFLTVH